MRYSRNENRYGGNSMRCSIDHSVDVEWDNTVCRDFVQSFLARRLSHSSISVMLQAFEFHTCIIFACFCRFVRYTSILCHCEDDDTFEISFAVEN